MSSENNKLISFSKLLSFMGLFLYFSNVYSAEHCSDQFYIDVTLPNQSRWDMCWEHRSREGIVYHHVFYTPKNGAREQILYQAAIAQIHVPYDDNGARYHDISDYGIGGGYMHDLKAAECPGGSLKQFSGKKVICQQVENRGLAHHSSSESLQGNALSLFSVSSVGAYHYIPQWRFYDDGTIEPSMGATGSLQRFGNSGDTTRGWIMDSNNRVGIAHLHNFFWRLDFDLGSSGSDDFIEELNFNLQSGKRQRTATQFFSETAREVNPASLRSWRIVDGNSTNSNAHKKSFEILLAESGHKDKGPSSEPFTHNDFFVTKSDSCEKFASHNPTTNGCKRNLAEFVNGQSISGQDIIVWVGLTFYHMPRVEDAPHMDAHWNHFHIVPRDWHASNPLSNEPSNTAPSVINPGNQTDQVGETINLPVSGSDNDGDSLSYMANGLPAGLSINNTTGVISGTINASSVGDNNVTVTIDDGQLNDSASFTWLVTASPNSPPTITDPGNQTNRVGDTVSLTIIATDPDNNTLSYGATGLPPGLSIIGSTGVISGTINSGSQGNYSTTVTVNDGEATSSSSFNWVINTNNSGDVIQIDGNSSDWSSVTSYQDTPGENTAPADFETAWITSDAGKIYIAYRDRQPIDTEKFWAWHVLIDNDSQTNTGYNDGSVGADYMLTGDRLFQYAGTGADWQWTLVQTVPSSINGKFAELAIDRSILGQFNQFRLNFYGGNFSVDGTANDFFLVDPASNGPSIQIDGNASDWSSVTSYQDTPGENTAPADFETAWITSDAAKVYIAYRDRQPIDTEKFWAWHVLIDNDSQTSTGFNDGSVGADYMLTGDRLFQYAGTGADWQWTLVQTVSSSINNKFVEFAIDRSILGQSNQFRLNFYGGNTYAGGTTNDFFLVDPASNGPSIQIDGNASDWSSVTSYQDTPGENTAPADYETAWFTSDAAKVYIAYRDRQPIDTEKFWAWHVLIDSDYQTSTGLDYVNVGADYMLTGDRLYQYAGTGEDWQWTLVQTVPSSINDKFVEFAIDRSILGQSNQFRLNFYGGNFSVDGTTNDFFLVDTANGN